MILKIVRGIIVRIQLKDKMEYDKEKLSRFVRRVCMSACIRAMVKNEGPKDANELREGILTELRAVGCSEDHDSWILYRAEVELFVQGVAHHSRTSQTPFLVSLGMMTSNFPLPTTLNEATQQLVVDETKETREWEHNEALISQIARESGYLSNCIAFLERVGVDDVVPPLPGTMEIPDYPPEA